MVPDGELTAIAEAIRAATPQVAQQPTWPVPVIAAVLVAAIGFVGAGVYKNGDRIDALDERVSSLEVSMSERVSSLEVSMSERVSSLEVSMSERFARIETLLEERLPERR